MLKFRLSKSQVDDSKTTANEFSRKVHRLCDNRIIPGEIKKQILAGSVVRHARLLTAYAVEKYLTLNPEVLMCKTLYRHFEEVKTPVGSELARVPTSASWEAEVVRKVLKAMKIMTPLKRRDFARLALKRFPNFQGRDEKTGRLYGFRWYLWKIAGYSSHNEGEKTKIPLPLPLPFPTVVEVESEGVFGPPPKTSDTPFLPEHLLRLPKTGRNQRKIKKYIESTIAIKPHHGLRAVAR